MTTSSNPYDSPEARRAYLDQLDRIAALDETEQDLVRLGQMPGLGRWLQQIENIGGCAHPIYIRGHTTTRDTLTGAVLREYSTTGEPGGRLAIRCRNRRAGRCPSCSRLHQGDSYHLVRAGLAGGKGIPEHVRDHPRVFATLTAPSFGPVHRMGDCHTRRRGTCRHGLPRRCTTPHTGDDPKVGQALCPACYDYVGHVLWNAHAPRLWGAFSDNLYHHFAAAAEVSRSKIRKQVRISAVKVAEYQARGAIHFHTVIRLDGPEGPDTPPPPWATTDLLTGAIRTAAGAVRLSAPPSPAYGHRHLAYGEQLDVHPLRADSGGRLTDERVAAYVAKYTTKSAHDSGAIDHRIDHPDRIPHLHVGPHTRALVGTCWRLGDVPELAHLNLHAWAHTLGYRGHCLTKSRTYSTTYGQLRAERARHRGGLYTHGVEGDTFAETAWSFAGAGHTSAEAAIAEQVHADHVALLALLKAASVDV
ncbi:replication initiator [Streptacidiphilus rugosus]|uniref:replication initiator n=1 Tax=Streptacidiphilus rugosus TaxID=405783 RepID=UPI000A0101DF|nr:replication initiator [Streptacidiphilus rugosus]